MVSCAVELIISEFPVHLKILNFLLAQKLHNFLNKPPNVFINLMAADQ